MEGPAGDLRFFRTAFSADVTALSQFLLDLHQVFFLQGNVGKNNFQNDELTFKFATGNDWWFHAKGIPGSHVVVKTEGKELPDRTFEEAGRLAAYYSKGREQEKVEIDYVQKKQVKKPAGAKPGFVVYYTNYSLMIDSDISGIEKLSD